MTVPDLAERSAAARSGRSLRARPTIAVRPSPPVLALIALVVVGALFRIIVADQSVFADELSTYWISVTHSLGGVLSLLYGTGKITHAEITPPLSFLASWLTTRIGHSPELLRLPALLAGTLSIPLVYLVGRRTVGKPAALLAAALTAFAPFMIYYSAEARAYGLMMFFLLVSTLSMLAALDTGRVRWWVLYAVSSCAAFYSHYTCVFVLAAQFLWLVATERDARRPAVWANVGAAVGVLPWITGLINDFDSPTLKILSSLFPFTAHDVRLDLERWAIGYPYQAAGPLRDLPGEPALLAIGAAVLLTALGLAVRLRGGDLGRRARAIDQRLVLLFVLALVTPVSEAVISAGGNHIFGVRNLAASWPYTALLCAALVTLSAVPPARLVAAGLAVLGLALGAVKMPDSRFQRPDYQGAADFIATQARPGDVVLDETGTLTPGPLTGLDVALHRRLPVFRAQAPAERDHPFGVFDPRVPLHQAVLQAVRTAHGARVFFVVPKLVDTGPSQFPPSYRLVRRQLYRGFVGTLVEVYAASGSARR